MEDAPILTMGRIVIYRGNSFQQKPRPLLKFFPKLFSYETIGKTLARRAGIRAYIEMAQ